MTNFHKAALALAWAAFPCFPHDPITTKLTWNAEIVRLFQKRCINCHGTEAAIPLAIYTQVRPWAVAIKEEVLARRMPPWGAVKGFGSFRNDISLTQEEIRLIADWVEGGVPEGEASHLPLYSKIAPPPSIPTSAPKGLTLTNQLRLTRPTTFTAIYPLEITAQTKLYAILPTGETVPLIWFLPNFKPRLYQLLKPTTFPAGTTLQSSTPARFILVPAPAK